MIAVADIGFERMSRLLLAICQLDHGMTKVLYDEMTICWTQFLNILLFFLLLFVFVMCLVCTMLPLSLDFPFLIALRFPLAFIYPIPSRFLYRYVYIVERFSVLNMHEIFAAVCKVTSNQFNNFYNWIYNNIFKNWVHKKKTNTQTKNKTQHNTTQSLSHMQNSWLP
jgi:hypothetical protein